MKALLLGGAGYVGSRLARRLTSTGHHVRVATRRALSDVPAWVASRDVVSLADRDGLARAMRGCDVVYHLAMPDEIVSETDPLHALRAGSEWTWAVMEALANRGSSCRIIFLSTIHVYGPNLQGSVRETTPPYPIHPYALSRWMGEKILQLFHHRRGTPVLGVRMSNAFGAPESLDLPRWSLVFNDLCRQAALQRRMTLKSAGHQRRNFITLEDAVRALEFLAVAPTPWPEDGVIHLGSELNFSIREAAEKVSGVAERVLGFRPTLAAPDPTTDTASPAFTFDCGRLASMGFEWTNRVDEEIEATLTLCRP